MVCSRSSTSTTRGPPPRVALPAAQRPTPKRLALGPIAKAPAAPAQKSTAAVQHPAGPRASGACEPAPAAGKRRRRRDERHDLSYTLPFLAVRTRAIDEQDRVLLRYDPDRTRLVSTD